MLSFIKNIFNKEIKSEQKDAYDYSKDYISPLNFGHLEKIEVIVPEVEIINNVGPEHPTIIIIDDIGGMVDLLYIELQRIQCTKVTQKFNIVLAKGDYAAFSVKDYMDKGGKVDIAFLDITLGGVKDNVELDGVDVALMIKDKNPNSEIRFITGHVLNKRNPEVFEFMDKFKTQTGLDIEEEEVYYDEQLEEEILIRKHIIGKNSNRVMLMALAIEQWLKRNNLYEKFVKKNRHRY